jgi:esterase/lipase superfamily enzyme
MSESEVIERHRLLANGLNDIGFKGLVVSFDWPSDDKALAYLSDRHKAKLTAMRLMSEGIAYLSENKNRTAHEYPCIRAFHRCLCFN